MILSIEILLSICKTTVSNFHFADFLKLSIYRQQNGMIDRHLNNYCNDFQVSPYARHLPLKQDDILDPRIYAAEPKITDY